uniref:Uncharacterized protein n=1 Tax=Pleurostichidium falkenbergii TaxID=121064 RepID=A0A4D6UYE5_9FLOR|nr:hypothetical protein [Pleurostichidium falkenbergii]QCH39564.1 hypothetical protein [Pleurostichidium falkenbergii]
MPTVILILNKFTHIELRQVYLMKISVIFILPYLSILQQTSFPVYYHFFILDN